MSTPRPTDHDVPGTPGGPGVESGPTTALDPGALAHAGSPETVFGTATPHGSITVTDGVLVLAGDIDSAVCLDWAASAHWSPDGVPLDLAAVDARTTTFLGSEGLALLVRVARHSPTPLPLWAAGRVVTRPLRLTGVDRLFDLRD